MTTWLGGGLTSNPWFPPGGGPWIKDDTWPDVIATSMVWRMLESTCPPNCPPRVDDKQLVNPRDFGSNPWTKP